MHEVETYIVETKEMDWLGIFVLVVAFCIVVSCCGACCKRRHRGTILAPPIVTTVSAPQTNGYSVTQVSIPGTRLNQAAPYPTQQYAAAYPIQSMRQQPMQPLPQMHMTGPPPNAGMLPYGQTPYPAMQSSQLQQAANMNPPPYDLVVADDDLNRTASYNRQPAYNPNYSK